MPTDTRKLNISALANMAFVELVNLCEGTHVLAPHNLGYSGSPLGQFLCGALIDTELIVRWNLDSIRSGKQHLPHSCRRALRDLQRDFATMRNEDAGQPNEDWDRYPTNRSYDLVFAIPALDGRKEQAVVSEGGVAALRATRIEPQVVEICVNLGARLQLQCRA
jgi:hypothetical protein